MSPLTVRSGSPPWWRNGARRRSVAPVVTWATEAVDGLSAGLERCPWRGHSSPGGTVDRSRQSAERSPVCVVEEPGEPDRPSAGEAGLDRQDQPQAAPGLPAEGRTPVGFQSRPRRGTRSVGPADRREELDSGPMSLGNALATAAMRFVTCSLWNMCSQCVRTVPSERPNLEAI